MIAHNLPTLGIEEENAAARVLRSGWVAQGPEVEAFENELCDFFGLPKGHAVAVSSGSAALFLALWVLEANKKNIGLPVYACSSLKNAVSLINGQPIYFDCAPDSPNIDMSLVCNSNIEILIAPSMFGIPIQIPTIRRFKIIEDIAQSIGALSYGQPIGLRGDVGICSFYATKMMTSGGQGGAVISRDVNLINQVKDYREFDCRNDSKIRFNFQMTDLQASVGRIQLQKLPNFIICREKIFSSYRDAGLEVLNNFSQNTKPVRYRVVIRNSQPNKLVQLLKAKGINAIVPLEEYELLDKSKLYSSALNLARTSISLPCYPSLSAEKLNQVIDKVKESI